MNHALARDPQGTTYLAPDGALYRLARYDVPDNDVGMPNATEKPTYNYWSPTGGSANGVETLPEGSIRVITPTPARPVVGSLFVTPDGTAYRLRDYSVDFAAEPFTAEKTKPSYSVLLPGGASTNAQDLPTNARLVWAPNPEIIS